MWYYARGQQTFGPVSWEELWRLAQDGTLQPGDFVVPAGRQTWKPAWQVEGLIPQGAMPALPEPETFSVRPGDPPMAQGGAPVGGAWPGSYEAAGPGFWETCWRHILRAFQWNLQKVEVTSAERDALLQNNVADPTLQRYLAWRHSILLVMVVPISLLALLNVADFFSGGLENFSGVGYLWLFLQSLLPFSMPAAAIISVVHWQRPRLTYRLMRLAWCISFLGPLVLFLFPADWLFELERLAGPGDVEGARFGARLFMGIGIFVMLWVYLPVALLSVAFGVQRACLRLKTLIPESMVPGLFLAASAPTLPLLLLPFFVLFNQMGGNGLLLLGMTALTAAPLMYLVFAKWFIQPLLSDQDFARVHRIQLVVRILFWSGLFLLLIYALTRSLPIPNFDQRPGEPGIVQKTLLGFTSEGSLERPWSWRFLRWMLVELFGRSLFTMVLATDLFMRVSNRLWFYQKQLAGSKRAEEHAALMEKLEEGMQR